MYSIKWTDNRMPKSGGAELEIMSLQNVGAARAFHKSFPQYSETPLAELDRLAEFLGVAKLCVKDESYRFGLNAFKGARRLLCNGALYIEAHGPPAGRALLCRAHFARVEGRDRRDNVFQRHRRQPRTRRRVGGEDARTESRHHDAEGLAGGAF